jgi:type VI secretion system secreted protein Hcp
MISVLPLRCMTCLVLSRIRKHHIVIALASFTCLAILVASLRDDASTPQIGDSGIPLALASGITDGRSYEMFLHVDTVEGESDDLRHRGDIAVDSFAWGETRAASATKPSMDGFRVTMPFSSAAAKMFVYGAGGTRIPRVTLSARVSGSTQDFLIWSLTDARILSYRTVGNTKGDGIDDEVVFGFAKIDIEYRRVLPNGSLTEPVRAGFDQRSGKGF